MRKHTDDTDPDSDTDSDGGRGDSRYPQHRAGKPGNSVIDPVEVVVVIVVGS